MTHPTKVGAHGSVESFDPADGIGFLRLDDGTRVRFGATACRGFVPVVGARVELVDVQPHPRHGWRAKRVALLDSANAHARRVQDTYGIEPPSPAQLRASATLLGGVSVLLDDPFPAGEEAQNVLLAKLGLSDLRFRHDALGSIELEGAGRTMPCYPVPEPIAERRLDRAGVGSDFPTGRAFLSLSLGMVDVSRQLRRMNPGYVPPVAELARLLSALSHLGPGIVLDQAEGLLMPSQKFRQLAAEPERLDRAFTGISAEHHGGYLRSRGMGYFASCDVAMSLNDLDQDASVISALTSSAWRGHDLHDGQSLVFEVGGQDRTYQVSPLGPGWWIGNPHVDERAAAHRAGMWLSVAERLVMRRIGFVDGADNGAPPHRIDVYSGLGTAMVSNGLALSPQRGGSAGDGNLRVELMCRLDQDAPIHGRMLSMYGGVMHTQDGTRPLRPWDGLRNDDFPTELQTMILVPHTKPLKLWPGHEVSLLEVVPVTGDEYQQLIGNPEAGEQWRRVRHEVKDWPHYHQRFNALVR